MGFSPTVRNEALTSAARHCCVCHRYKGVKIEVHHIKPEAEGGPNTIDNAIALCFDCHTDAGHYNDQHPKGTKFSRPELKLAREKWYKIVQYHHIQAPSNTSDHFHFKHLILRDYQTATEILSGNLKEFPFPQTILLRNEQFSFCKNLIDSNTHKYRIWRVELEGLNSIEEMRKVYPDIVIVDKTDAEISYFEASRIPTREELVKVRHEMDSFMQHLLDSSIDPALFCKAVFWINYQGCGDDTIGEPKYSQSIIFKPFWFSFLTITNTHDKSLEIEELIGNSQNNSGSLLHAHDSSHEESATIKFPKLAILPNQTVLVSTGLLLSPFNEEDFNETIISDESMEDFARSQVITHKIRNADKTDFRFIGKYFKPTELQYNFEDRLVTSEMHTLDLNNVFMLDRHWHIGSCPHLFYKRIDEKTEYVRELFIKTPGIKAEELLKIPENISEIILVELEDEITYIQEVSVNRVKVIEEIILNKGEEIRFAVKPNDHVSLIGYYKTEFTDIGRIEGQLIRNRILGKYLLSKNKETGIKIKKASKGKAGALPDLQG